VLAQASFDDESTILLEELNHRFLNSFQVIASLAARCGRAKSIAAVRSILNDLEHRVVAFGTLHRMLAFPVRGQTMEAHCRSLCDLVVRAFGRQDRVSLRIVDVHLSAKQATRIPIIVVEMVTNVLKHSLAGQPAGLIEVELTAGRLTLELNVRDIGGVPPLMVQPSRTVEALAASLDGSASTFERGGYVASMSIPRVSPSRVVTPAFFPICMSTYDASL